MPELQSRIFETSAERYYGNGALTLYYLQEELDVIFGKSRLVEQVPDEVVNEDTRNDLKIVEFGNQDDKVR